jgi:hypothetical protein
MKKTQNITLAVNRELYTQFREKYPYVSVSGWICVKIKEAMETGNIL